MPKFAYDSFPNPSIKHQRGGRVPLANDAGSGAGLIDPEDVAGLADWIKTNLDLAQQGELVALLTDGNQSPNASDAAPPRSYLGTGLGCFPARQSKPIQTAAAEAEFAKMFPEARRKG